MKCSNISSILDNYSKMGIVDKLMVYGVNNFYSSMQCEISLTLLDHCIFDKYTIGSIFIKSIDSFLNVVECIGLSFYELEALRINSIRALYGDVSLDSLDDFDIDEMNDILSEASEAEGCNLTSNIVISDNSPVGKFISFLIEDLKSNGYTVSSDDKYVTISGWK